MAAGLDVDNAAAQLLLQRPSNILEGSPSSALHAACGRTSCQAFNAESRLVETALSHADGGNTLTAQQPDNNIVRA